MQSLLWWTVSFRETWIQAPSDLLCLTQKKLLLPLEQELCFMSTFWNKGEKEAGQYRILGKSHRGWGPASGNMNLKENVCSRGGQNWGPVAGKLHDNNGVPSVFPGITIDLPAWVVELACLQTLFGGCSVCRWLGGGWEVGGRRGAMRWVRRPLSHPQGGGEGSKGWQQGGDEKRQDSGYILKTQV